MIKKYVYFQPNKKDIKDRYGDCVVRSICKATGMDWLQVFDGLTVYAREVQAMPNNKVTYHKWLQDNGFKWVGLRVTKGSKRPTPKTFCKDHKTGTYILALANHLVAVTDGHYYDTWDSGEHGVYGYYEKL